MLSNSVLTKCCGVYSKLTSSVLASIGGLSLMLAPAVANENETSSRLISVSAHSDVSQLNQNNVDVKTLENVQNISDVKFRNLYSAWRSTKVQINVNLSIPSIDPVSKVDISSYYGYRTDPFRGRRKNHKGIDIRGPVGTPIYATADGFVKTSKWFSSYGKFIEIDHGNAIHTRYGHMSKLIVSVNQYVRKGDIIGLMGSTGRSTGSHLHYEVRIAGEPVNPQSFMANATNDTVKLAQSKNDGNIKEAQGGPAQ